MTDVESAALLFNVKDERRLRTMITLYEMFKSCGVTTSNELNNSREKLINSNFSLNL